MNLPHRDDSTRQKSVMLSPPITPMKRNHAR